MGSLCDREEELVSLIGVGGLFKVPIFRPNLS